jgi:hypothetical protein
MVGHCLWNYSRTLAENMQSPPVAVCKCLAKIHVELFREIQTVSDFYQVVTGVREQLPLFCLCWHLELS